MDTFDALRFAVSDRINDAEVGLAHVPLALLGEFQKDVAEFLKGSGKELDPGQVIVSIEEGSLALVASGLQNATALWKDVALLRDPSALGLIDPRRAAVVEHWQKAARKNAFRSYRLADAGNTIALLRVDANSEFRNLIAAVWVPVEKYLTGLITDMGGTHKANVHMKLPSGQVQLLAADQQLLAAEERNRLYKPATVLVRAEENLKTGELRNLSLVAFPPEKPDWNEAAFASLVEKGTQAWKDVPDDWLEEMRSSQG